MAQMRNSANCYTEIHHPTTASTGAESDTSVYLSHDLEIQRNA